MNALERLEQPAFRTAGATLISYGLILLFMFVLLFVVPYLVYSQVL